MPVELWIPDQDWLESTEMTVGQSEWPEAADVSELRRKDKEVVVEKFQVGEIAHSLCFQHSLFPLQTLACYTHTQ